jgi:hypothetical protein
VQFRRKTTFDAGATPGLDDFERPDLKSVSGDLVDELRSISDEKERRESELADLRQELEEKEHRIAELERELEEARDLRRFADQMAQAMFQTAEAPYRGGKGRNLSRPDERQRALREYEAANGDEVADIDVDADESEGAPTPTADGDERDGTAEPRAAAEVAEEEAAVDDAASADPDVDVPFPLATDPEMHTDAHAGNGESSGDVTLAAAVDDSAGAEDDVPDSSAAPPLPDGPVGVVAADLREQLAAFDEVTRGMLAHYRSQGIADPVTAQVAAGGPGDHKVAYARNRTLRKAGFVRHAGRGKYAYALPDHVRTEYAHRLNPDAFDEAVEAVEVVFVDDREVGTATETDPTPATESNAEADTEGETAD